MQKRLNLTRTVRKLPINDQLERVGHYIHDDRQLDIKYDEVPEVLTLIVPFARHLLNVSLMTYALYRLRPCYSCFYADSKLMYWSHHAGLLAMPWTCSLCLRMLMSLPAMRPIKP